MASFRSHQQNFDYRNFILPYFRMLTTCQFQGLCFRRAKLVSAAYVPLCMSAVGMPIFGGAGNDFQRAPVHKLSSSSVHFRGLACSKYVHFRGLACLKYVHFRGLAFLKYVYFRGHSVVQQVSGKR